MEEAGKTHDKNLYQNVASPPTFTPKWGIHSPIDIGPEHEKQLDNCSKRLRKLQKVDQQGTTVDAHTS
jgi:hypothetical protein